MIFFANGLRGLLLAFLVAIVVLSVVTLRRYAATARRSSATEHRRSRHIVKVATSHIGFLLVVASVAVDRIGDDVTPFLIVSLLLSTLTLSALIDLLFYQRIVGDHGEPGSP